MNAKILFCGGGDKINLLVTNFADGDIVTETQEAFGLEPYFETDGVVVEGLGGDGGMVAVADGFGDGESEAEAAAGGAGAVFTVEAVKEAVTGSGGGVLAGVVKGEEGMAAGAEAQADGACGGAVFAGVV